MKIHLLPEHEAFIREKVESGEYESADDVVTDALFCFQHIEQFRALRREELRREIQIGIDELDRGESAPLDVDQIKAEGRRRLKRPEPAKQR